MRRAPGVIALTALVVVLAGCSDSSEPETEESPSADASASASESPSEPSASETEELPETSESGVPADVEEGVLARLDAADGLLGTAPDADPPVLGLEEFNAGAPPEQLDALEERGFVAGAYEQLKAPKTVDAVRVVIAFETAEGAAADVKAGADDLPGEGEVKRFDVPGVPGAEGFDVYGQQGLIGRNVAFNVDEFELIVGVATQQPPTKPQVTREEISAVARGLVRRGPRARLIVRSAAAPRPRG